MTQGTQAIQRLWFEPVLGPELDGFWLEPGAELLFGRGSQCDIKLPEATISRQHGRFVSSGEGCFLVDLGSRQGTFVNDTQCQKEANTSITTGDMIRIGPWIFRTSVRQGAPVSMQSIDDSVEVEDRVQRMTPNDLGHLAQHRLSLLIECSADINKATNLNELGSLVVKSAIGGTGFQRAAMLMHADESGEIQVIGFLDGDSRDATGTTFSKSLLDAASRGDVACLLSGQTASFGQSIADLNIHSAICSGILVDDTLVAYLYLDAREQEQQIQPDAAGFCQALCQMAGLAYANLRRLENKIEQARLEQDLSAAREAQQLLIPKDVGAGDVFVWGRVFKPGREASGDLLDIIPLSENKLALVVGDVSGKGAGAAILMSSAQSFIHARITSGCSPEDTVTAVNKFVAERSPMNRFLTLWVGIFDAEARELTYVDAGHGHWAIRRVSGISEAPPTPDGFLIGIDANSEYRNATLFVEPGDRIIIFSDGIPEQQTDSGEQYGVDRVYDLVAESPSAEEDVKRLLEEVISWAGSNALDDDTTIVSLGLKNH
ncbi:MAG TPA: FHA domain-containing protein [Phycisphaerales bacterium]|nr:FHA domain-containing protein [Phycisphaerales bacterium]HIB00726.1 FHA domain-containing protein [Phycisphaerales bacterium]HIB51123.1 FHA domain-containing protein [Phycisphaerales bacterium]HIN83935.1 FHA domain-containing protein [Phycisphaerales bacterium]